MLTPLLLLFHLATKVSLAISERFSTPSNKSCETTAVPLISYHIHVLFPPSDAAKVREALALQLGFMEAFSLIGEPNCTMSAGDPAPLAKEMCAFEIDWAPAGPFLTAQYSFFVPSLQLTKAMAWTVRHRGTLDVLVHPNSGCEVEDHTRWAMWGGNKWEIDSSIFSCEYPGCVPPNN
jgi:aromatic ring-cleaving dioxygenase